MSKKAYKHIDDLLKHFSNFTYRLALCDIDGRLMARSSGFLYRPDSTKPILVITTGHGTPVKGAAIETSVVKNDQKLCLNAGEFQVFYTDNQGQFDYAYSVLPVELIKRDLEDIDFPLEVYQHKFVKAIRDEAYGFAVLNDYQFVTTSSGLGQQRFLCYDVSLELQDQDDNYNYFKLSRPFPGDDYYRGASGSPIFDPEGAITSIFVGGAKDGSFLKAFRLDNIDFIYPSK